MMAHFDQLAANAGQYKKAEFINTDGSSARQFSSKED
jgi:hypothetical protein